MIKVSHYSGADPEVGQLVFPLFTRQGDAAFEKIASPRLMEGVCQYINQLQPQQGSQYVLVNAMGAGEFYSSNINADHFPEEALTHCPEEWSGDPAIDIELAKNWPYGFPTFYNAHPYAHHKNKDPSRAYGAVEYAGWNACMRRVELVIRVDYDKCKLFGGVPVWDKLAAGQFVDVSMGSKVPFDTCSIDLDWDLYREAQATFDPKKHEHPGKAVLEFHKLRKAQDGIGIRGLSITRKDYSEYMLKMPNRILADGRKVFVYNDYPRFFDISFVFIGADKTAKVMVFVKRASDDRMVWTRPGAELAEKLGYVAEEEEMMKAASAEDKFKTALAKMSKKKAAEILKEGPSQFDSKAVPVLTKKEEDLPEEVLDTLGECSREQALSAPTSMGIVLKPREFQRITIIQMGLKPLADDLDEKNIVFPRVDGEETPISSSPMPMLERLLSPFFEGRSCLSPAINSRITMVVKGRPTKDKGCPSSHPNELLHKIGSAYTGYRKGLMTYWSDEKTEELAKMAGVVSPFTSTYLEYAYWNEVGR